jgi:hypothetical protein
VVEPIVRSEPNPDPTERTKEAVDAASEQWRRDLIALREIIETRINGIVHETSERVRAWENEPARVDARIAQHQLLIDRQFDVIEQKFAVEDEKFSGVDRQFVERDVRGEQSARSSADALAAALQAAKELVGAQGEASAAAAVKSETSFALALDTPLLTVAGWKTMGTVEIGDVIFAEDGSPAPVIATSGIFLDSPCFNVAFSDGSVIVATGDHRWHVYDVRAWHGKHGVWKTLSTQNMIDTGCDRIRLGGNGHRYRVTTNAVLETVEADLPIDPYIFGYWLGDGSSNGPIIAVGDEDKKFVVNEIEMAGYRITNDREQVSPWGRSWALSFNNEAPRGGGLWSRLNRLGVRGPGRKHIPDLYLTASSDQRRALLAGLLDSDGTISRAAGRVTFNSTLEPLAAGVRQLARSLGQRAVIHKYGDHYHVTWPPTENPFRMPRKSVLYRPSKTREREWASVTSITAAETAPARCLTVEHPSHVFLAGHGLIPSHNTKQIDQIGTIIQTLEKALDARITELKERIDRGEGNANGVQQHTTESRLNNGLVISLFALLFLVVSVVVPVIIAVTKK